MGTKIGFSELILMDHDVEENVARLIEAGADSVEVMMDASGWDRYSDDYMPLAAKLKAMDVPFTVHPAAWDINLTSETRVLREAAMLHYRQALDFAAELGASQMVVHPGHSSFNKETARKRALESVNQLAEVAKNYGVRLAFENVGGPSVSLFDQESFAHALDDVDPIVGYLIDIGHANMNHWNLPQIIEATSERLLGLHIHDNFGSGDDHLPVGQGGIDWDPIWQTMRRCCRPDCEWILEYAPGTPLHWLTSSRRFLIEKLG